MSLSAMEMGRKRKGSTCTSDCASAEDEEQVLIRRSVPITPKIRDDLLEESILKLNPEESRAKELTADEFVTLQSGLQQFMRSEMKLKMNLLQKQLSEYHSILEEVIAYKSRCEQLEQEKKDIVTCCREACQVRDMRIMLLEKQLAWSQGCRSKSDEASSSIIGSGSEEIYFA